MLAKAGGKNKLNIEWMMDAFVRMTTTISSETLAGYAFQANVF